LPELVLSHQELVSDKAFEFLLSSLDRNELVKYRNSFSFYIVNIKVFLSVVGVDWIEFEKVLFAVG
jgi:hypothetical protein